jgi:hypothetical protein
MTGPVSARMVLADPQIDIALIERDGRTWYEDQDQ